MQLDLLAQRSVDRGLPDANGNVVGLPDRMRVVDHGPTGAEYDSSAWADGSQAWMDRR